MRKFICLTALTAMLGLILTVESDASGRRRIFCCPRPCCQPCCDAAPCCPATGAAMAPPITGMPAVPGLTKSFVTPKGRTHTMTFTSERGYFEKDLAAPLPPTAAPDPDGFRGNDRKAAKTSIAMAKNETFADVAALAATLPADNDMLAMGISKDPTSNRVAAEKRNVEVTGFLYAVKHEDDNDFHLIVGTDPDAGAVTFLNVEVSGLPAGGPDRAKLNDARKSFKTFFSGQTFTSSYVKFNPPIAVKISGSLFFDVDHAAGVVGPTGHRPKTAWEIHPATALVFEP